nr:hypothetical protein [uncultured Methanospirillum sp.]
MNLVLVILSFEPSVHILSFHCAKSNTIIALQKELSRMEVNLSDLPITGKSTTTADMMSRAEWHIHCCYIS